MQEPTDRTLDGQSGNDFSNEIMLDYNAKRKINVGLKPKA